MQKGRRFSLLGAHRGGFHGRMAVFGNAALGRASDLFIEPLSLALRARLIVTGEGWSRRGEAMGRRCDIWRCKFEKSVRLQHMWCELLEAEAREERESEHSKEGGQPPAPQTSSAYEGSFVTSQEKMATRTQPAAEEEE